MKYAAGFLFCGYLICFASEPPSTIFNRAAKALAAGNYAAAEQGFREVLRHEPQNVGAIANLGIVYARTDHDAKAIVEYKRALRLSPNNESILLNLGIAYFKQDRPAAAKPYLERVAAMDAQNRQARQLLAVCQLYTGQVKPALHELENLQAASPQDQQLLFLLGFAYLKDGNPKGAKDVFQKMFTVAGPVRTEFLLGRACYEAALFPQAEQSFLKVQQLNSEFPGLHLALGKLYISERRTGDAIRELKQVLKQNPNNEEASYFLGSLLVRQNRSAEGILYLERARNLKPDSWAVYLYLGRAKLQLKQTREAVALLQKAAELNPDNAELQYQLARALQLNGEKTAAARVFERVRKLKAGALSEISIPGIR